MVNARWQDPPAATVQVAFEGTFQVESPLSIGAAAGNESSDQPVIRGCDGNLMIPGTSLAGVVRARLLEAAERAGAPGSRAAALRLMGGEAGDAAGLPATLIVDDLTSESSVTEVRDHVRLDMLSGTVDDRKKFDREAVPVGTRFKLRLEWHATAEDRKDSAMRSALLTVLTTLAHRNGIELGGHTRRGFGSVRLLLEQGNPLSIREVDLLRGSELADLVEGRVAARRCTDESALKQWAGGAAPWSPPSPCLSVNLTVKLQDTLLVRGSGRNGADASAFARTRLDPSGRRSDELVVPGASTAGALRQRATRIAALLARAQVEELASLHQDGETVRPETARAIRLVEALFGTDGHRKRKLPGEDTISLRAGAIRIGEAVVQPKHTLHHTRVSIDPWTGGALESFLFTEEPIYGGAATLRVHVDPSPAPPSAASPPQEAILGLAMLALRDLWSGDLPLGGEAGIGRGCIRANHIEASFEGRDLKLSLDNPTQSEGGKLVAAWVRETNRYLTAEGEAR